MALERSVGVRVPLLPQMRTPNGTCFRCDKPIYIRPSLKGTPRFCSQECFGLHRNPRRSCEECGNCIKSTRNYRRFCSVACSNKHRRGIVYDGTRSKDRALTVKEYREAAFNAFGRICVLCGIGEFWQGQPLTLQVDHINGDRYNNSLDNLRVLCPNCHSQTPTFNGKHLWKKKK